MPLPASKQGAPKGASAHPLATDMRYVAPAATVLNVKPESRFVYRWSPDQWELVTVDGKPTLIPQLSKILLTKGVNGIPMARDGKGMLQARTIEDIEVEAIQAAQLKGWGILKPDLHVPAEYLPPGVAAGPYRRAVMTTSGEGHWHDCFETHTIQAMGGVKTTYHRAHFHRWMAGMVEAGNFGAPPDSIIPEIRAQVEMMRANRESRLSTVDGAIRASRLAPLDAQLDSLSKLEAADA